MLRHTVVGSCLYVLIDKVLRNYCCHEEIRDQILSGTNPDTDSEYLTDYCDGQIFKQHAFFKYHPNPLRLHFYEDEFEVVNP